MHVYDARLKALWVNCSASHACCSIGQVAQKGTLGSEPSHPFGELVKYHKYLQQRN